MNDERRTGWRGLWVVCNWGSAVGAVAAALALGYLIGWGITPAGTQATPGAPGTASAPGAPGAQAPALWVCSMNYTNHPYYSSDHPGKCAFCGMNLIPASQAPAGAADPTRITLSPEARALAKVTTAPVERKFVSVDVRMVGKIDYDETRLSHISAWFPGRLDRLFVNYTGVTVGKGEHMVEIYSPALLSGQEEFLQSKKARDNLRPDDPPLVRESAEANYQAAGEKLRLLGLSEQQVEDLARTGKPADRLTLTAPIGGVVVEKHVEQGVYVDTGTRIYSIADLSVVWVRLEAYESDLVWLRYGQQVEFTAASYPGRTFSGMIAFIDPILTEATRTVRIRVSAVNADGALKPGLFVHAVVRSNLAAGGKVMAPNLAGKWISPMHPEIIKDAPGVCDVCGMALVRAEDLGYVSADPAKTPAPLVVPASAVMPTGKRAVVYVEVPDAPDPTYVLREVKIGPRAGDYYLVEGGLYEGEQVVVRGNFLIDSERQIRAQPSMMAPTGGAAPAGHVHGGPAPAPAPAAAPSGPPAPSPAHEH